MVTGTVNSRYEMTIKLPVRNSAGQQQEIEAVLDSGFTGSLTLPPSLIASLGLPWRSRSSAILANGHVEEIDIYAGFVYLRAGRPTRAIANFRRAVEMDPACGPYIATVPLLSRFSRVPEFVVPSRRRAGRPSWCCCTRNDTAVDSRIGC